MPKTERLCLDVEEGEIITFKRGVVMTSAVTNKTYLVKN